MRGSWNYKMTKMLPAELLDLHHLAEELIHTSGKFLRTLLLLPEGLIINLQAKTLSHVASGKLCFAWSVTESSASVNTLYKVFINILSHLRCPSIQHDLIQSPHVGICLWCCSGRGSAQRSSPSRGPAAESTVDGQHQLPPVWLRHCPHAETRLLLGCFQSRPGMTEAASIGTFLLNTASFTKRLLINHRSGWNFSELQWNKALPP